MFMSNEKMKNDLHLLEGIGQTKRHFIRKNAGKDG